MASVEETIQRCQTYHLHSMVGLVNTSEPIFISIDLTKTPYLPVIISKIVPSLEGKHFVKCAFTVGSTIEYKTGITALKNALYSGYESEFRRFVVKGSSYYVFRGNILDDKFTPLVLMTEHLHKEGNPRYTLINPKVYTNTDEMSKQIVKKLIPGLFYKYLTHKNNIVISSEIEDLIKVNKLASIDSISEDCSLTLQQNMDEFFDKFLC